MNPMPRLLPLAAALALAGGCQATGPGTPASATSPADAPQPPSAAAGAVGDAPRERPSDTVILGEATYRERIKMPPGATLHVELVTLGGSPRVLARAVKPDVAGPPIPFALPYDASRVDPAASHGLRAELVGPDGERWFATAEPVSLVPGSGMAVELLLRRASGPSTASSSGTPATASTGPRHWECGDLGVMSRTSDRGMRLDANGVAWSTGGAGVRFDVRGDTARLVLPGEAARDCVAARQPSPWNDAVLRGLAFRAVGNEPGWFVEVDAGTNPTLRATLDYGERRLDATPLQRTADGYRGTAGGRPVVLVARRNACTDGMSGQRFPVTATLRVGDRAYSGCGAFLAD